MDSSACGHLFVHQPRSEQSEGQSPGAPRAQLPLGLGDITASQCRSHFKLISLCTMFFKSFLNKTEIQCFFPLGYGNKDQGICVPVRGFREKGYLGSVLLQLPRASFNQQSMSFPTHPTPPRHPGTSGAREGHCGKASLETGHMGVWPGTPAAAQF